MTDNCPLVYVIILSWNSRSQLEYCLPTVIETIYPRLRIIVVDNASADDTVTFVHARYPQAEVICVERNLGYSGGNNVGVRHALRSGADYITLLNPDTRVDSRWISEAVRVAEQCPRVGLIGFKVFGEYMVEDENGFQFEIAKARWDRVEVTPTSHISGCALFCRANLFRAIGLFDEVYFAYGEEDDFEWRTVRAGYQMVRINVPIWHSNSASFGRVPFKASFLSMRNTLLCSFKNAPLSEIWQQLVLVFSVACNPWTQANLSFVHYRRLRPSNVVFNSGMLAAALAWNLWHLPRTLRARKQSATAPVGGP